jgi:hypothetical protein
MWIAVCGAFSNYVKTTFTDSINSNVYCDSTSNVNRLLTMDYTASLISSEFNFTIALANATGGAAVGYTISMSQLVSAIYNETNQ